MEADHIVDIGPLAGELGGEIVYSGDLKGLLEEERSITGAYLSGRRQIPTPQVRRKPGKRRAAIGGRQRAQPAEHHGRHPARAVRLRHRCVRQRQVDAGAGRAAPRVDAEALPVAPAARQAQAHDGWEQIDKVIDIDQSPIGRTPRSNPATYTGVFDHVRKLFAQVPEARIRGYQPGRFSFNVRGGRCENCAGDGQIKIEMHFLPDVYVTCEVCKGRRYNRETLEVKYKGRSISDVLEMSVEEALEFFQNIPPIHRHMQTLSDVGLGLHQARAAGAHAVGRRGAADQALVRAAQARDRQHDLRPGRAHDRPALRGHPQAARRAAAAGGGGQHRPRDRAQPRRGEDRGLDRRPRPRGRRHGRPAGRGRHARAHRRRSRTRTRAGSSPRSSAVRRSRTPRRKLGACAAGLTMLARIPADVSKRLLILTCAAALLAGACSNLPEANVNFGTGKEFVPYVADHLDDAGLGNADRTRQGRRPVRLVLHLPGAPSRRAPSPSHGRSGRRSSRPAGTIRRTARRWASPA